PQARHGRAAAPAPRRGDVGAVGACPRCGVTWTLLALALGAVAALWQELRRREALEARDKALAGQAAAEARAERAEAAVAALRSEIGACHDALETTRDPAAVRRRLRDLLSGQG